MSLLDAPTQRELCVVKERWRFKQEHCFTTGPCSIARAGRQAGYEDFGGAFSEFAEAELVSGDAIKTSSKIVSAERRRDVQYLEDHDFLEPVPSSVLAPKNWRRVLAGAWVRHAAIHSKEARVSLMGLRRASRMPSCRGRSVLSLGDNLSEITRNVDMQPPL